MTIFFQNSSKDKFDNTLHTRVILSSSIMNLAKTVCAAKNVCSDMVKWVYAFSGLSFAFGIAYVIVSRPLYIYFFGMLALISAGVQLHMDPKL